MKPPTKPAAATERGPAPAGGHRFESMAGDIARILIQEPEIGRRLDDLAEEITADLRGLNVTVVAILNGSFVFLADLLRRIPLPLQVDCLSVASYHGMRSTGVVAFRQNTLPDLNGRHVLLLDDILDSGRTLDAVRQRLLACPGIQGLKTCVLLDKAVRRAVAIEPDYAAFQIGDEFVVGYGLDYNEHYRNLPFIGVLTPAAILRGQQQPASPLSNSLTA